MWKLMENLEKEKWLQSVGKIFKECFIEKYGVTGRKVTKHGKLLNNEQWTLEK